MSSRTKSDSVRQFILKLKKDIDFRASFVHHPIEVLAESGITLSTQAADEFKQLLHKNKDALDELLDRLDGDRIP